MDDLTLVTGADGFIGSHLVEHLVRRGSRVRAFVMYNALGSHGWLDHIAPDVHAEIEVIAGDVRDAERVSHAVEGCAAVLHLAALIGIPYSYVAPRSYLDTNVVGTLHVLEAARRWNVRRFVQTSTSEVYGTARTVPITEDHPLSAQSPYAASKIAADQLALSYHAAYGMPVTVLRPFNTYGPRQSARAVIPTIITQLGDHGAVRLGNTAPTRDFTYVEDTAAAFAAALDADDEVLGQVVNVGSDFEISVAEVVRVIADQLGVPVRIESDPQRVRPADSEVDRLWADTARARKLLAWSPAHGGIDGFALGIAQTVAWFAEPANRAVYHPGRYEL